MTFSGTSGGSGRENISGIKHPAFRDAVALTRAGGRTATGRYLVEDADLVRQALAARATGKGAEIFAVFTAPGAAVEFEADCATLGIPLYVLGSGLITKLVGTGYETAVAAVAVVAQRLIPPEELLADPNALILCGERIQDPRNVGVLIRTAEAAGCAALLLSADSAEPFSRQAVRSTTGSLLRLPLCLSPDLPKTLSELRTRGAKIAATSGLAPLLAYDTDLATRPLVLVVGNEQMGVSAAVQAVATEYVRLPMASTGVDSLNVTVAAGALLYEAVRQGGGQISGSVGA